MSGYYTPGCSLLLSPTGKQQEYSVSSRGPYESAIPPFFLSFHLEPGMNQNWEKEKGRNCEE